MLFNKIGSMQPQNGRFVKEDNYTLNLADVVGVLNVKDGFHITTTENNAQAEGLSYVATKIFDAVAAEGLAIMHFKTGANIAVVTFGFSSDGAMRYYTYTSPIITGNGTSNRILKRNLVTLINPTASVFHTPTYSSLGDKETERATPISSGPAKGGTAGTESRVLILPPNTSVFYVAQNKSATAAVISADINWVEVIR